jgi:hypothetical protein
VLTAFELQFVPAAKATPRNTTSTPASLDVPAADFKGVRTFAAEVKHVAETNHVFYSVMSGMKFDSSMDSFKNLKTKDEGGDLCAVQEQDRALRQGPIMKKFM